MQHASGSYWGKGNCFFQPIIWSSRCRRRDWSSGRQEESEQQTPRSPASWGCVCWVSVTAAWRWRAGTIARKVSKDKVTEELAGHTEELQSI
jgi:hypothetical protein